ncbi:type II secretion system F family protein [Cohnella sp. GbtcB17]|uniref:type II secretion system F family protein n=1 Tax=Cohnella sp. GbtcB17 TaxID=2824762 RepID=UPI001C2F9D12|nr:type II secretion system F family protein [Cohnella sp. GbtcB17]
MLTTGLAAAGCLLFLLLFAALKALFALAEDSHSRSKRLGRHEAEDTAAQASMVWLQPLFTHLADVLAASGWRMKPNAFWKLALGLAIAGFAVGAIVFQSLRSSALLGAMLAILPYSLLRMSLVNRQISARLNFLPAAELFYQCYLVNGSRHVRTALQRMVEERQLPGDTQAIFEELYRQLNIHHDDERTLRRFSMSIGHIWADYFSSLLAVALSEGNNISDNLRELIDDMRKARMDDHAERHRLLEIRLANFTPLFFLGLFLAINFRLNAQSSALYYLSDPGGRSMLLNALVLIFGSFLMGLYLSRRKL